MKQNIYNKKKIKIQKQKQAYKKKPTKQKQIIVKLEHSISYHKHIFKCMLNAFLY